MHQVKLSLKTTSLATLLSLVVNLIAPSAFAGPTIDPDQVCSQVTNWGSADPQASIVQSGQSWTNDDTKLCDALQVNGADPNCSITLPPTVTSLAGSIPRANYFDAKSPLSSSCQQAMYIFGRCQHHSAGHQLAYQCAAYNASKGDVQKNEIGLLTSESLVVATCSLACGLSFGLPATAAAFERANTLCTLTGLAGMAAEIAITEKMKKDPAIKSFMEGTSLGVNSEDVESWSEDQEALAGASGATAAAGGAAQLVTGLNGGASAARNAAGATLGEIAAKGFAKRAQSAVESLSLSRGAGSTINPGFQGKIAEKAALSAQKGEAAAKKAAEEAAEKLAKKTAEATSKEAAKKAATNGQRAQRFFACAGAALATAQLGMRAAAFVKIKNATNDSRRNIIALSSNPSGNANNQAGGGSGGGGGGGGGTTRGPNAGNAGSRGITDPGSAPSSGPETHAGSGSEAQTHLSAATACLGDSSSTCNTGNTQLDDALQDLNKKPDIKEKLLSSLPNLDSVVEAADKGGAGAAMAASTPGGLPENVANDFKGLQELVVKESPKWGFTSGSGGGVGASSSGEGNPLGMDFLNFGQNRNPAGNQPTVGLLDFAGAKNGKDSGYNAGGLDIWHSGNPKVSIFQIISSRMSLASQLVDQVEWSSPLNRAVHGLRNIPTGNLSQKGAPPIRPPHPLILPR